LTNDRARQSFGIFHPFHFRAAWGSPAGRLRKQHIHGVQYTPTVRSAPVPHPSPRAVLPLDCRCLNALPSQSPVPTVAVQSDLCRWNAGVSRKPPPPTRQPRPGLAAMHGDRRGHRYRNHRPPPTVTLSANQPGLPPAKHRRSLPLHQLQQSRYHRQRWQLLLLAATGGTQAVTPAATTTYTATAPHQRHKRNRNCNSDRIRDAAATVTITAIQRPSSLETPRP